MSALRDNMGQGMSDHKRDVFELMTKLLQQHGKSLLSHNLKILLKWASVKLLLNYWETQSLQ